MRGSRWLVAVLAASAALTCAVAARGATLPAGFVEYPRERPDRADGDGVRAGRPPVRRRAGRSAARDQEREPARDAVRHAQRQLGGRTRAARDRVRPRVRDQPLRLRLLHDRDLAHPQPRQPLHRQRRRRRPRQRDVHPRPREPVAGDQPQRRRDPLRPRRQALRRGRRERERRELADARRTGSGRSSASTPTARSRPTTRSTAPATGANRAIWALGLRNPFTFAFQPGTGRMFINDVGQSTWEEIDDGIAGSNYGWPTTEGPTIEPAVPLPALRLRPRNRPDDRLRHHRRRVLRPVVGRAFRPTTTATTSSPTSAAAGSAATTRCRER